MEIFLLAIILIIIIVLRTNIIDNNSLLRDLKRSVDNLEDEVKQLHKQLESGAPASKAAPSPVKSPEPPKPVQPPRPSVIREINPPTAVPVEQKTPVTIHMPGHEVYQPAVYHDEQESWFDKWLKNNPDMEKFIGENLVNKIGIAVLVLGIAFFVKYAIDQNWIKETGRVAIGLACGGILVGLAHRLRNAYHSFSSVLVGGGLTVFYFTIAFAFHEYHLLSQTNAFISMVVITAFAVTLSVLYNRIELAILATIGGFITPFLLSTGQNNYIALFTYLAVLNTGLIILAYLKHWRVLNLISLVFTLIIFGGWFVNLALDHQLPYRDAFCFATLFYVLFITMNLVSQFSAAGRLKAFDFAMLLAANTTYYAAGLTILQQGGFLQYKGIFTASLGALNLILAYVLFKKESLDKNFIYLLVGLTVTYISLTAPVQLKGNYITLFWAAESVLLLWLYQRSFIRLIKLASLAVTVCMLASLAMDWSQVYSNGILQPVIFNKGFVTALFSGACLFASYLLMKKEADTFFYGLLTNWIVKKSFLVTAFTIFFMAGSLETHHQFTTRYPGTGLHLVYLQLFAIGFFTTLFILTEALHRKFDDYVKVMITAVLFILYLANASNTYSAETGILVSGQNRIHLAAWLFNAIAVILLVVQSFFYLIRHRVEYRESFNGFINALVIASVAIASIEIRNAYIWSTYSQASDIPYFENLYFKAFLTIIWGLSSFGMIWLGMKYRFKSLRITALVLFGITLVKLFCFDIRNIPPAGKIAAFILLGILLLVVSFMYQRLKKLIIDNAEK